MASTITDTSWRIVGLPTAIMGNALLAEHSELRAFMDARYAEFLDQVKTEIAKYDIDAFVLEQKRKKIVQKQDVFLKKLMRPEIVEPSPQLVAYKNEVKEEAMNEAMNDLLKRLYARAYPLIDRCIISKIERLETLFIIAFEKHTISGEDAIISTCIEKKNIIEKVIRELQEVIDFMEKTFTNL